MIVKTSNGKLLRRNKLLKPPEELKERTDSGPLACAYEKTEDNSGSQEEEKEMRLPTRDNVCGGDSRDRPLWNQKQADQSPFRAKQRLPFKTIKL